MNNKVVVLASGGLDSSVLLAHYMKLGYEVYPMYIQYGNANIVEERAKLDSVISKLEIYWGLEVLRINLSWTKSEITSVGNTSDGLYVNMRNLVFIANAVSYAESIGASKVAVGFISVPCPYRDASPAFLEDINNTVNNASGITVEAPLIYLDKQRVYELGLAYGLTLDDTISCNTPVDGKPCGVCEDCADIRNLVTK